MVVLAVRLFPKQNAGAPSAGRAAAGRSPWVRPKTAGIFAICLAAALPVPRSAGGQTVPLTNIDQVRALNPDQAARHLPVRLTGEVISDANGGDAIVLWSQGTSIYIRGPKEVVSPFARGDWVQVDGQSDPGAFAPLVQARQVLKLGTEPIPEPIHVTFEQLLEVRMDAQWVAIRGVVRSCEPIAGQNWKARMVLESGGKRLQVQIDNRLPSRAYMDAEVVLRGICFFRHNNEMQALGPFLAVPRGVSVLVTNRPVYQDAYQIPPTAISNLLRFSLQGSFLHRVRVRGTVIHAQLAQGLWIRQGGRGLHIQSDQADPLHVGQAVEVVGFPSYGLYTPILEDAVFRAGKMGAAPAPIGVSDLPGIWQHDADLVELEARLQEIRPMADGWALLLEWNGAPVRASLRWPKNVPHPDEWLAGSRVRVAGICSVDPDANSPVAGLWRPQSFQLLMRSPQDLLVLEAPPWWTSERIMFVLAAVTLAALATAGGIAWLARRRSRRQELERVQAEKEFAAVLTERNRIAREIHDTLAQGLGAVSLELELAKNDLRSNPPAAVKHVELAQQSARESLADARHSIWNMRSQVLENGDLVGALEGVLRQQSARTEVRVRLSVKGHPRRLSPVMENDLLRVGQEAIANAVKHAKAAHIEVELEFSAGQIGLTVRDDGRGFAAADPATEGGFGLTCMRQRAEALHGKLEVRSAAGKGVVVELRVPNAAEPISDR